MARERLAVAGTGRAGTGIGLAMRSAGLDVTFITTGPPRSVDGISAVPVDDPSAPMDVDWILLAVPDSAIAVTAGRLGRSGIATSKTLVGHLSGALPSSIIAPSSGFSGTFSAHPLFSFPTSDTPLPMPPGVLVMIETDSPCRDRIDGLFVGIGADTAPLRASDKHLYHAAAVMCANLPMALVYESAGFFKECGVPDPETAAVRLLESVLRNHILRPGASSITGPFVRADRHTIETNMRALTHRDPEAADLYRQLGERLADLLFKHEILSEEPWKKITKALK